MYSTVQYGTACGRRACTACTARACQIIGIAAEAETKHSAASDAHSQMHDDQEFESPHPRAELFTGAPERHWATGLAGKLQESCNTGPCLACLEAAS